MKKRIRIRYGNRCVHIPNDAALYHYLQQKPNGEYHLADHILRTYRNQYGKELRISRQSLATEIRWHVRVYRWMQKTGFPGRRLDRRMKVIDCGERKIDNNRFIWDLLSRSRRR